MTEFAPLDTFPDDFVQDIHWRTIYISEVHFAALFSPVGILSIFLVDINKWLDDIECTYNG
jgi:hypothetical protein